MNHTTIRTLLDSLKLPAAERKTVADLLAVPEVEAVMNREEARELGHRRSLAKQLTDAPAKHARAIADSARNAHKARERHDAALMEMRAATEALCHMDQLARGAGLTLASEQEALRRELREGRDKRLDDVHFHLTYLDDTVRALVTVWPVVEPSDAYVSHGNRSVRYAGNLEDVKSTRRLLAGALAEIDAMTLAALSHAEVTERLASICAKLAEPLASFELSPPTINELGEVEAPKRWVGVLDRRERVEAAAA